MTEYKRDPIECLIDAASYLLDQFNGSNGQTIEHEKYHTELQEACKRAISEMGIEDRVDRTGLLKSGRLTNPVHWALNPNLDLNWVHNGEKTTSIYARRTDRKEVRAYLQSPSMRKFVLATLDYE